MALLSEEVKAKLKYIVAFSKFLPMYLMIHPKETVNLFGSEETHKQLNGWSQKMTKKEEGCA